MYLDFFGFRQEPFNITPNSEFLYLSSLYNNALQHLNYGIKQKKGFILLTGEVGCGKTTLCRKLLNELDPKKYDSALIINPRLSETQMLEALIKDLNLKVKNNSKNDLMLRIGDILLERIRQNRDIVLIIDEAQCLSNETLEFIRLLSNLETDEQKLLQIILIGQPELNERLEENRFRQLKQRVLVHCHSRPLTRSETVGYINHRLSIAGNMGSVSFTSFAVAQIHRFSKGIPRLINNICDKSLLAAFIKESSTVSFWNVRKACKELRVR